MLSTAIDYSPDRRINDISHRLIGRSYALKIVEKLSPLFSIRRMIIPVFHGNRAVYRYSKITTLFFWSRIRGRVEEWRERWRRREGRMVREVMGRGRVWGGDGVV